MESILARALEYTLKYWLKSFTRDQFRLQGRTVQLSNLVIDGDALHSSIGLPPALSVTTAKVGKLEIMLPSVSNVQIEPIVVQIDRLDLVLKENAQSDASRSMSSIQPSTGSGRGSGYGFADKIADGMTLEVGTVNLLLETRGGASSQGGATWASPMASITIRNLLLYTTNEDWEVVNLKEARDFSTNTSYIYVFKKLEWQSLSIDMLPHPDMFMDLYQDRENKRDDDGAKRVFFGGERFIEGISGEAYITIQRTELNSPLGLEFQLHVTEGVCATLSEPGLRALLRFLTGLYVCLNRGDVDPKLQQGATESAGCSLVSVLVDHIFLRVKDVEFQLELLMQSLFISRASVSDGENDNNLSRVTIGGLFLRDMFSRPPCTLVQPSMQALSKDAMHIPDFAVNFCPPIYPLGDQHWRLNQGLPFLCIHSLQTKPSPAPPSFASQTVIDCQPLMIYLQEESFLRISSFLADGIVVNPGSVLPDFSVNSLEFTLKELDLTVPLDIKAPDSSSLTKSKLHIENLSFSESPSLKLTLLNLEKDPSCFSLWDGQPVDASQKKWTTEISQLSLSLEMINGLTKNCAELNNACIEVAMVTEDGSPLLNVPPPGGIVRVGVASQQFLLNTSVEQLFLVLDFYTYFGRISEKIAIVGRNNRLKERKNKYMVKNKTLMEMIPCDTAVSLAVEDLQLKFIESSSMSNHEFPLLQFIGEDLFVKVSHRSLGGAMAISSIIRWESVEIDSVDVEKCTRSMPIIENGNLYPQLRSVFWVHNKSKNHSLKEAASIPFLDISIVHVIPYNVKDAECHSLNMMACIASVRLGGGMNYLEALMHRFGIFGPDGGPGEGLSEGLKKLSAGPFSKLLKTSPLPADVHVQDERSSKENGSGFLQLGKPDDVDVSIELKDWLFALEGADDMAASHLLYRNENVNREERCWHTSFQSLMVKARSNPKHLEIHAKQKYPIELVTVGLEGLQILKPNAQLHNSQVISPLEGNNKSSENTGGVNVELQLVISEDMDNLKWVAEHLKFSVRQPIEAVVTKEELQHLTSLCKSEVDSMGRIAAGILRVLKLEDSIGQAAIDQLSNLGSEGLDKIFKTEKLNTSSSTAGNTGLKSSSPSSSSSPSIVSKQQPKTTGQSKPARNMGLHSSPSSNMVTESQPRTTGSVEPNSSSLNMIGGSPPKTIQSTVALLEETVSESQAKLSALTANLGSLELTFQHISDIRQLRQKLENMQTLLKRLRTKP